MLESASGFAISAVDFEPRSSAEEHALVAITSRRGIIVYVNERFCEVSGYSRRELIGVPHGRVGSGRHSHRFWRDLWQTIGAGRLWRGEICNCAHDGTEYWVDSIIRPLRSGEEVIGYIAVSRLVTSAFGRPSIHSEAAPPPLCATG
jgi:PAS domain S-box-containing protein